MAAPQRGPTEQGSLSASATAMGRVPTSWVSVERDPTPLTRDEPLDTDPHWSPDGRSIVFSSDREGTMDLWVKDVDTPPGAGERRLTDSHGAELSPAWSTDWISPRGRRALAEHGISPPGPAPRRSGPVPLTEPGTKPIKEVLA